MLIMMVVGLVFAVIGLVLAARAGWRLYKQMAATQRQMNDHLATLVQKQEMIFTRMESIQANQVELNARLATMQQAFGRLSFIVGQWSQAAERVTGIK